jgi:hypothetical protein
MPGPQAISQKLEEKNVIYRSEDLHLKVPKFGAIRAASHLTTIADQTFFKQQLDKIKNNKTYTKPYVRIGFIGKNLVFAVNDNQRYRTTPIIQFMFKAQHKDRFDQIERQNKEQEEEKGALLEARKEALKSGSEEDRVGRYRSHKTLLLDGMKRGVRLAQVQAVAMGKAVKTSRKYIDDARQAMKDAASASGDEAEMLLAKADLCLIEGGRTIRDMEPVVEAAREAQREAEALANEHRTSFSRASDYDLSEKAIRPHKAIEAEAFKTLIKVVEVADRVENYRDEMLTELKTVIILLNRSKKGDLSGEVIRTANELLDSMRRAVNELVGVSGKGLNAAAVRKLEQELEADLLQGWDPTKKLAVAQKSQKHFNDHRPVFAESMRHIERMLAEASELLQDKTVGKNKTLRTLRKDITELAAEARAVKKSFDEADALFTARLPRLRGLAGVMVASRQLNVNSIVSDPEWLRLFREFLEDRYASNDLMLFVKLTPSGAVQDPLTLFNDWISPSSSYQVNLSGTVYSNLCASEQLYRNAVAAANGAPVDAASFFRAEDWAGAYIDCYNSLNGHISDFRGHRSVRARLIDQIG